MTDERCERTDLITTQCAHCLGHTDPTADAVATTPITDVEGPKVPILITANFAGRCPDCGEFIHIGDTIVRRSTGWCCTECEP